MAQRLTFPLSTGKGAVLIGVTEPQLAETVRRGKVKPPPPLLAGRRLWAREHLLQAAEALGVWTVELEKELRGPAKETSDGG